MTTTIAISGKGGSGKTTLAAMIIRLLASQTHSAILAVDADPNSSLGLACGVEQVGTIAEIREQARTKQPSGGMDKLRSFEYGIQQAITEATEFDLLTMGRPEGPDCYCAVNNMLRTFLDKLSSQYQYVVIDNEAGMEHLSRRTTNNVDLLLIVTEPTVLGALTAQRIFELANKLPIAIKEVGVIWNSTRVGAVKGNINKFEIPQFGRIPYDENIFDSSMQGKNVFELEDQSPAFPALREILNNKLKLNKVVTDK